MNIQRKNSAHHFRMQSEREQTLGILYTQPLNQFQIEFCVQNIFNLKFFRVIVRITKPNKLWLTMIVHICILV